ncbi:MAG: alpha/beta hydrolase [Polyangia bacterium]
MSRSLVPLAAAAAAIGACLLGGSWSGACYAAGLALLTFGLVTRGGRFHLRGVTRAGALVLLATLALRLAGTERSRAIRLTTTDGGRSRLLTRVVEEGDLAVPGARLLVLAGALHDPDARAVPGALRTAYAELRAEAGEVASPVLTTYAGLQSAQRADLVVIEPRAPSRGALIFLHGFAGNFTLQCWLIAQAARAAGLVTLCPSTGWRGDWWSAQGEQILRGTVKLAREQFPGRLFAAGLSNGGAGLARLAPRLRGTFDGLVLISGTSDAPAPGAPVLVVHGSRDAMSSAQHARAYAARVGGEYTSLDAGHFALLLRREEACRRVAAWLERIGRRREQAAARRVRESAQPKAVSPSVPSRLEPA